MENTIVQTSFNFEGIKNIYRGKVRDVYTLENDLLVMIATDRISAFDIVLPKGVPYKGQIINQIAVKFMKATNDIVPNWMINSPDPNVIVGYSCIPFKIEMVIRGFLSGHAARVYKSGKRILCGVTLPEGMKENDRFDTPIITPTTKANVGSHDEDISKEEILLQNIVSEEDYHQLENYTKALFDKGSKIAEQRGLYLVDTKYEFGKTKDGRIVLIDEIHTPDSSRYFYKNTYQEHQNKNIPQKQLSKEFVRQWLIDNGFQGKENQSIPPMTDEYITHITERYIELYEKITAEKFQKSDTSNIHKRIEHNVNLCLEALRG